MARFGASMQHGEKLLRVRRFLVLLLLVAGSIPLLVFGFLAIRESEQATIAESRRANQLLAQSTAARIDDHLRHEVHRLTTAAAGMRLAPSESANRMAAAYLIDNPHWHNLTVVDEYGETWAAARTSRYQHPAIHSNRALQGELEFSPVRAAEAGRDGPFAHSMSIAIPIYVVGSTRGALLVDIDLVELWAPINATRVGNRGFVRLLTAEGLVLAHGHPDDRRDVYAGQNRIQLLQSAKAAKTIVNSLGQPSMAVAARVESMGWYIIVEQPLAEAYATAHAIRSRLIWFVAIAILVAILLGLWFGRSLVGDLESLEQHTDLLAKGDLSKRVETNTDVNEIGSLAASINAMASSLDQLHASARAKERITTFGRVAAGLAHDLRQPIETLQVASMGVLDDPDDPETRELFRWTVDREMPRLRSYLDDLQHLASEGEILLHASRVNLEELVKKVMETLSTAPKWNGVEFSSNGSADDIDADEKLLARALYNLAANGADSTLRAGDGRVCIEVADIAADSGDTLQIRVIDNGCGMSDPALKRVLEGDFHSTKRVNGVGLGFGIARHIMQSHGGHITGCSTKDSGTTFTCAIPRTSRCAE